MADVAFVVDHLGIAPVVLVGQSMGGNTAFLTASAHGHDVHLDAPALLARELERFLTDALRAP